MRCRRTLTPVVTQWRTGSRRKRAGPPRLREADGGLVFGIIKSVLGFASFSLRGLDRSRADNSGLPAGILSAWPHCAYRLRNRENDRQNRLNSCQPAKQQPG